MDIAYGRGSAMRYRGIFLLAVIALMVTGFAAFARQRGIAVSPSIRQVVRVGNEIITIYENSWALVIGINDYRNPDVPDLEYAVEDARAVKQALIALGFPEQNIITLYNSEATREEILEKIQWLINSTSENDRVVIYFAGHGVDVGHGRSAVGYLIPYDGDPNRLYATGISMVHLRDAANLMKARHVLYIVDACFSGLIGTARSLPESKWDWKHISNIWQKPAVQIITAGTEQERVYEGLKWQHSVFTYYLLRGLSGEADKNKDNIILISELYLYIESQVRSETKRAQHPQLYRMIGDGEFMFIISKVYIPPPRVIVHFESEPAGASVVVGGEKVCDSTPCSKAVEMGQIVVNMSKEGYYDREEVVSVEKNGQVVRFKLTPRLGYIHVSAHDYAKNDIAADVYIDGKRMGGTFERIELIVGKHTIEIKTKGKTIWRGRVDVQEGRVERVEANVSVGGLKVSVSPSDAKVEVNGKRYEAGRLITLPPGRYEVVAYKQGYHTEKKSVDIVAGEELPLHIRLYPASWARGFAMAIDAGSIGYIFSSQINSDMPLQNKGSDISLGLFKFAIGYRHFRHFGAVGIGLGDTYYAKQVGVGDYICAYPFLRYDYYILLGTKFEPFVYTEFAYYPESLSSDRIVKFAPEVGEIVDQDSTAYRISLGLGFHKEYWSLESLGNWGLILKVDMVRFNSSMKALVGREEEEVHMENLLLDGYHIWGSLLYEISFNMF